MTETEQIPYDEMRRLCGLPDVSAYIARRDLERGWNDLLTGFLMFGEAFVKVSSAVAEAIEPLVQLAEALTPKHTPPIWAIDVSKQKRDPRSGRRVK